MTARAKCAFSTRFNCHLLDASVKLPPNSTNEDERSNSYGTELAAEQGFKRNPTYRMVQRPKKYSTHSQERSRLQRTYNLYDGIATLNWLRKLRKQAAQRNKTTHCRRSTKPASKVIAPKEQGNAAAKGHVSPQWYRLDSKDCCAGSAWSASWSLAEARPW